MNASREKREEGRGKREEGRRKKEEGRGKKEVGSEKRTYDVNSVNSGSEARWNVFSRFPLPASRFPRVASRFPRRFPLPASRFLLPLLLAGCSWFTDFKQQPKFEPWETPNDTTPFRANPQNSVPIYGSVAPGFIFARTPFPQSVAAMASLVNPTPADSASVHRGKLLYQINCSVCHGPSGMGNGTATKYGMPGIGIGVGSNAANTLTDGYIFGMMRNGRGLMPSYNRIEEPGRWDVVNYLRSLQGKNNIPADTTHGFPGETGAFVPGATISAPTRPAPYVHPSPPTAADTSRKTPTDTTRKPEHQP